MKRATELIRSIWNMIFLVIVVVMMMRVQRGDDGAPQVPCYFVFGDSLCDNGNNNLLETAAKANYYPYGIDFEEGPTGRFTNGKNMADNLAELLGFDSYRPPFATANGTEIIGGGEVISLSKQLVNHQTTVSGITSLLGNNETAARQHLSKCLYTVNIGSNDYINNYLLPQYYSSSSLYSADQYASILIQQYSQHLTSLYSYGARKVAIFGLGPIGCTPAELSVNPANASGCVDFINDAIKLFNDRIKPLVDDLNHNLPDAKFIFINLTSTSSLIPGAPFPSGSSPCCNVSRDGGGLCIPGERPCRIRFLRLFYDAFHPTEIANRLTTQRAYTAFLPSDAYPFDIRHLVRSSTHDSIYKLHDSN